MTDDMEVTSYRDAPAPTLEPCPFCGSSGALHDNDWCEPPMWSVHCTAGDCFASVREAVTPADAIAAWNRRSLPNRDAVVEECARVAENVKGGYSANIRLSVREQELVPDEDGPWVLNSSVAASIRSLKGNMDVASPAPPDGVVEAVAEALWLYMYPDHSVPAWAELAKGTRRNWRGRASAAISAYQKAVGER